MKVRNKKLLLKVLTSPKAYNKASTKADKTKKLPMATSINESMLATKGAVTRGSFIWSTTPCPGSAVWNINIEVRFVAIYIWEAKT